MYETFYGLKEKPFTLLPDPDYLYLSPKHQRALTLLEYGMMNQAGFSVICGDTGAGKTTLIRRLLSELGDDTKVGLITNTHHSFGELLNWVLMAFGLDGDGKSKAQMHQMFIEFLIDQYAQNKHTVLIVDEAQNMSADTLEELRMLSNINADKDQVLQVILAGQPALRETLRKPELMQFAQRIAVDYYLESLSVEETQAYIEHRLSVAGAEKPIFTSDACSAIFKYSGGTPRLINLLCDTSLVYGFAEQTQTISEDLVHDVVREQHSNSIIPTFNTGQPTTTVSHQAESLAIERANDRQKTQANERVAEASVNTSADETLKNHNNETIVAELAQQTLQQSAAVANSRDASMPVDQPGISATDKQQVMNASVGHSPETALDDTNVTPINVNKPPEKNASKQTSTSSAESLNDEHAEEPDKTQSKKVVAASEQIESPVVSEVESKHDESVDQVANSETEAVARYEQPVEDVYPIVHIEEPPKKGISLILFALVGGMFIASIIMMVAAWMMFGGTDNINRQAVQQGMSTQSQRAVESREFKALQKERDAAIAVTRALERERDAALQAAKAQEEIRAAELRASEILAAQERKATRRLEKAQARAREAELAESKARARERRLKLKAEKREADLEQHRLKLLREERIRLDALAVEEQRLKMQQQTQALELQRVQAEKQRVQATSQRSQVKEKTPVTTQPKNEESFSSNPCNSPSAKFLSTCKK